MAGHVKPGDVLLYEVASREKGKVAHYYACEVVADITDGGAFNLSGEPITGVRAIYRPDSVLSTMPEERILVAWDENNPDDKSRLGEALARISGPGELVTGVTCQCEAACSMLKMRL